MWTHDEYVYDRRCLTKPLINARVGLAEDGTVRHFREKPPPAAQAAMAGQSYGATDDKPLVASMGE